MTMMVITQPASSKFQVEGIKLEKKKNIKNQTCSFSVALEKKEVGAGRGREVEITIILNHYMVHYNNMIIEWCSN